MRFKATPQNLLERIGLIFNLVPLPLVDTQVAFNAARSIMAAAELGIFKALGKGKLTHAQISDSCKTHPDATKHLLDCLVGVGYLKWSKDQYYIKPKFYKWLLTEYSSNLIGKLRFQLTEWDWMSRLEDFVRTGKPVEIHSVMNADQWSSYQDGMRDLSVNTAKELAGKISLPGGATNMLDIGGSHGLYSIELCKKNPGLSSTILELPGAIDRASNIAAQHGLTYRVKYQAGNALDDDLGEASYDLVLINNVVHHFTEEQNIYLAQKVARALKPGGIYGVGEFIRQHTPTDGDEVSATSGLYFALTSSSGTWSQQDIHSWQQKAGLKVQKTISPITLPGWKMLTAIKK